MHAALLTHTLLSKLETVW